MALLDDMLFADDVSRLNMVPNGSQAIQPQQQIQAANSEPNFFNVLSALSQGYRKGGLIGAIANAGNVGQQQDNLNRTAQALMQRGLDQNLAKIVASDPALIKSVLPHILSKDLAAKQPPKIQTFEDPYGRKSYAVWDTKKGTYVPFSLGAQQQPNVQQQNVQQQMPVMPGNQQSVQSIPAQQQTQVIPAQQQQVQALPAGFKVGPPVPKVPEGYVHKLAQDGSGYLYQANGSPVFETKKQAEERAKNVVEQDKITAEQKRVAQQFAGGLSQLQRFPDEFGKRAFERAIGPLQSSYAKADSGGILGSGLSIDSVLSYTASALSEIDQSVTGGAEPTEVRDRVDTATRNLAAVMKPLVRKSGEGAWTDKDQENLEKQLGALTRSRSVDEYRRRWNDIKENVSRIFLLEVPKIAKAEISKNPPEKANEGGWSAVAYDMLPNVFSGGQQEQQQQQPVQQMTPEQQAEIARLFRESEERQRRQQMTHGNPVQLPNTGIQNISDIDRQRLAEYLNSVSGQR